MNYLKLLIIFIALPLVAQDQLRFINGDKWVGELKEFNDEKIYFKSELSDTPLTFKVNNLTGVTFPKNNLQYKKSISVYLTNGDTLVGDLLEMDQEYLTLDTTFAGALQLPKKTITRIHYNSKKKLSTNCRNSLA